MPTAVFITALPLEYKAVRYHLTDLREERHEAGTVYERGGFGGAVDAWTVGIVEAGAGNAGAAATTERAIAHFRPDVVMMVGVAGGVKDVKLGDIVAATKVYVYESGKSTSQFQPRPDVFRPDYGLEERARAEAKKSDWLGRIHDDADADSATVFVAPVAAGEKVIAAIESDVYKFIRQNYGDAVAVEMEGAGFLRAVHNNPGVRGLVVRGVSDLIEKKADDDSAGWQERAAARASAFAFQVLSKLRLTNDANTRAANAEGVTYVQRRIFNTPLPTTQIFVGRDSILRELAAGFSPENAGNPALALVGLGGIGKTQIAIKYAYDNASLYDVVWWFAAEQKTTLAADFNALAEAIGTTGPDDKATVAQTKAGLASRARCLLIFDNAEDPGLLAQYLPPGCHTLITSRNQNWPGLVSTIPIAVLDRPASVSYLLTRTGQSDSAAAKSLAAELGDLPLALAQAAGYMQATGMTIGSYFDLFKVRRSDLLARGMPVGEYGETVATTWALSFQDVETAMPAAADLLRLSSFLPADTIALQMLRDGASRVPQPLSGCLADAVQLNDAIAALRRYSLVERNDDKLSVHRLVQAVTQDQLSKEARREWKNAAIRVEAASLKFNPHDSEQMREAERMVSRAIAWIGGPDAFDDTKLELLDRLVPKAVHREKSVVSGSSWQGVVRGFTLSLLGVVTLPISDAVLDKVCEVIAEVRMTQNVSRRGTTSEAFFSLPVAVVERLASSVSVAQRELLVWVTSQYTSSSAPLHADQLEELQTRHRLIEGLRNDPDPLVQIAFAAASNCNQSSTDPIFPVVPISLPEALSLAQAPFNLARYRALQQLAAYPDDAAAEMEYSLLDDCSIGVRRRAIRSVAERQHQTACEALVKRLREEADHMSQCAIVTSLGRMQCLDAIAPINEFFIRESTYWANSDGLPVPGFFIDASPSDTYARYLLSEKADSVIGALASLGATAPLAKVLQWLNPNRAHTVDEGLKVFLRKDSRAFFELAASLTSDWQDRLHSVARHEGQS